MPPPLARVRAESYDGEGERPAIAAHIHFAHPAMTHRIRCSAVLLLAGLGGWACATDPVSPDPCRTPPISVVPDRVHFAVGDTVLFRASLTGAPQCLPPTLRMGNLRWRSTDSLVARISANKGYLVAKGPGETVVTVYYPGDGSVWGEVPVVVTP